MLSREPALLLTGATGLVGGELLQRLLAARPDRRVVVLSRQAEKLASLSGCPQVSILQGDLTLPHLGLDPSTIRELQSSLTEIIHCAAEIRFGVSLDQARAANTAGTKSLLDLARGCRGLEKFGHVSTIYVAGRMAGRIAEAPLSHRKGFFNAYQQSKYEAEGLVLEAMREVPIAIYRLSSIIGDSQTGRVRQFNHVHQLLKVFPRNVLPMAPGDPAAPIDLVSTDWVVAALAHLFENRFVAGRIYQLCAGPEASLTVREMLDLTAELFESHPAGRRWLPIRIPRLVSLAEYEKYVERRRRGGDRLVNELLRVLGYFLPHLGLVQNFDNRRVRDGLAGSGIELPPIRTYYGKVVQYCLETDWGRCV